MDVSRVITLFKSIGRYQLYSTSARITVPHKMARKLERMKTKSFLARQTQKPTARKGPSLIVCHRKEFNHYKGQTYSDFSPKNLASGGWKHYKSKGDYFTIQASRENPSLHTQLENFDACGLSPEICKALSSIGIEHPTHIQELMIPEMLAGHNILCTSETGSGKTFAFLLPILERLRQLHNLQPDNVYPNQPAAVIISPLRELADQIQDNVEKLSVHLPFIKSLAVCGGRGTQKLLRNPPVDNINIIVTTPGVFSKLLTNRIFSMERLSHIVFDEADTLFDDSFNELTLRIIRKMKIQSEHIDMEDEEGDNVGTQVVLVGATVPKDLQNILGDILPVETLSHISTPYLHRLMPHVPQKFVRLGPDDRPEALIKHLKKCPSVPTIVFCNKSSTAGYLRAILEDNGINSILYHSQMSESVREGRFKDFQDGRSNVLVCTDIASRGLDTIRAQHVINYEFPNFMSDYIHRVGRVGRVASHTKGFALNFISYKWDVDLLWKIETAARRTTELYNVNANIKRKLTGIIERKFLRKEEQYHL